MKSINLLDALAELLNCEVVALHDYLNPPSANNKVQYFLKGKKLRTSYLNRNGQKDQIIFGAIGLKNTIEQHAYEGYLGSILCSDLNLLTIKVLRFSSICMFDTV
jgi:hypothetical protein